MPGRGLRRAASRSTSSASGTERVCTSQDLLAARRCPAAGRRRGGRSGRGAAAPCRARRAGWSRRARSRRRRVEAVHLGEDLVERLLALVVAADAEPPPPRARPIASSSSMKMIAGAASSACSNRSRTREAPTPTIASMNSEADAEKNGTPASPATARASSVLPVPGGPASSTPRGMRAPSRGYLSGLRRKSTTSTSSLLGLVDAGDVVEGDRCVSASTRCARERPNWPSTPPPAPPPAARRNRNTNSATSRIVGPNENRIVSSSERLLGRLGVDRPPPSRSAAGRARRRSRTSGTRSRSSWRLSPSYSTSFSNSPSTLSARDEISLTLPVADLRRGRSGCTGRGSRSSPGANSCTSAQFRKNRTTRIARKRRGLHGSIGGFCGRPVGARVTGFGPRGGRGAGGLLGGGPRRRSVNRRPLGCLSWWTCASNCAPCSTRS